MHVKKTRAYWQRFALGCACDAHENHFPSRSGIWFFEDQGVLCVFNNNPYAKYPTLRDEEVAQFRQKLRAEGIKELAYATYPGEGDEQPGYTYALLIDAGEDKIDWVVETLDEIQDRAFRRAGLYSHKPAAQSDS